MRQVVFYRTVKVDGLSIFYREAGPKDAPSLLLLHGLPSSSRMFEPLIARLSDQFHLIAPDYPASATAIGQIRSSGRIPSIASPPSFSTSLMR
jgi:pimeloyl-ACP methyl ester carboxylesterase